MSLFLCLSCGADYQVTDKIDLRVVVDSYVQPDKLEKLDVLVALDTSGSMHDNYEDVADGMEMLRSDIESLTLDYQFGYITMDPTRLSYVGPYDASASSIDMLMATSLLESAYLEEGFSATYTFLESEEAINFRRPDADFLLFLISDEDEQSAISADLFYEWLNDNFRDVSHDVVCVVHPDTGEPHWSREIGYKYVELSNLYGKDVVDLQAEDWSVWLSNSSYLTQRKDYIYLSEENPVEESIVVYVDQVMTKDWTYVSASNKVMLGFVPEYGSVVEVGYHVYEN